jgi:uncharacterized protein
VNEKTTMTRFVGLSVVLLLTAMFATDVWAAPKGYSNDGGGPENATYFLKLLNNLRNHVAALAKDHVEIRVVDHGDGIVMLQMAKTNEKLAQSIDARKADGVRFLVCQNTLDERNIDWHTLYGVSEQDIVPSGVAELARLQMKGFVYIHP